jgi:hypothetical protein
VYPCISTSAASEPKTLKQLHLEGCYPGDDIFRLIADGLVGNTTMDALNIYSSNATSASLYDITRMIQSTQLKTIGFLWHSDILNDQDATKHFVSTLQQKKSSVQELPNWTYHYFPTGTYAIIENSLKRNKQLNRAALLLVPPPPQQQQHEHTTSSIKMLKISHKAIAEFAVVANHAGASAIFKLFQARPALLEKRIKRPPLVIQNNVSSFS